MAPASFIQSLAHLSQSLEELTVIDDDILCPYTHLEEPQQIIPMDSIAAFTRLKKLSIPKYFLTGRYRSCDDYGSTDEDDSSSESEDPGTDEDNSRNGEDDSSDDEAETSSEVEDSSTVDEDARSWLDQLPSSLIEFTITGCDYGFDLAPFLRQLLQYKGETLPELRLLCLGMSEQRLAVTLGDDFYLSVMTRVSRLRHAA